jgi:hypothetical protein
MSPVPGRLLKLSDGYYDAHDVPWQLSHVSFRAVCSSDSNWYLVPEVMRSISQRETAKWLKI